jgi:NAD(P)-dependent dehydrogenase (short-subunit alcohol dehydrogenase family)
VYRVPTQVGKLCVVTGSNSGTGKEAARRLAGAGASVVMAVRNVEKGEVARREILAEFPDAALTVSHLDLADLSSVAAFAESMIEANVPIDVVLNNGGLMAPPKRIETTDGFEVQFATNFLGHFALTLRLLPLLLAAAGPTVTTMSSVAASFGHIRFDDLQWHRHYSPYRAYAQSKLADLLFATHLAQIARERNWDLMSNAAHPGYTKTNLLHANVAPGTRPLRSRLRSLIALPAQGVEQGAEPMLYGATSPDAISGAYYGPRGPMTGPTTVVRLPRRARHPEVAARLWSVAEGLTGVTIPASI